MAGEVTGIGIEDEKRAANCLVAINSYQRGVYGVWLRASPMDPQV